jgi:two-component system LytT family response regulator
MTVRTVIVDDEALARRGIRALLEGAEDIEVVSECCNGREAIEAIAASEPQLVYLDIQMPGKSGFEVIDAMDQRKCPHIIFVTAFDKFAVQAFDVHALDFLLKPLKKERFYESLERARAAVASAHDGSMLRRFAEMAAEMRRPQENECMAPISARIPVKTQGRVLFVQVADIDWVEADRDYVSLHTGTKSWLVRETIAATETRLTSYGFVRIHRSALVNANRVRELRSLSKGELAVVLLDGTELKLSRNYRSAIPRLVGAAL